jgi:flagellar hook-basal body complex protein FliE
MADPLGLIGGSSGGLRGLGGNRGPLEGLGGARPGASGTEGPDFKETLIKSIDEVNRLQAEASAAQEDLVSGQRTDVENVILATQKADTAFRALLAVRNKVQAALEEFKQVRV